MRKLKIAVVDDDVFIRESWELYVQDFEIITFASPEAFLRELTSDPALNTSLDAIVVDYSFGTVSNMSGSDLAAALRQLTGLPIILSTDMCRTQIDNFEIFDIHLDKNVLDWQNLGSAPQLQRTEKKDFVDFVCNKREIERSIQRSDFSGESGMIGITGNLQTGG